MTIAAIDWLSISINLLLVVFVIVCLLMTLLILMQRPKQEGLGAAFGGGVTDQVFGARTTNVLQKGTVWLGSIFFVLALILAILIGIKNQDKGLLDKDAVSAVEEKQEEADQTDIAPEPQQSQPSSLLDELPAEDAPAPVEPAVEEPVAEPEAEASPESVETVEEVPVQDSEDKPAQP